MWQSMLCGLALAARAGAPVPESPAPSAAPTARSALSGSPEDPRNEDPVKVQGQELPSALGKPIDSLRVGAIRGGEGRLIPHQIDERRPDGAWVYRSGPEADTDVDGGLVDANDELVFMAADAGEEGDPWRFWSDAKSIDRLTVFDTLTQARRYVYLLRWDAPAAAPAPTETDYARYDPAADSIDAVRYVVGFPNPPKIAYQLFKVKPEAGGNGEDLFDRFKLRIHVAAMFNLINITVDEDDMDSRLSGYSDGPVRVLRRIKHWMELGLGIGTPEVIGESLYYATWFEYPSVVDIPFELDYVLSEAYVLTTTDFNRNAIGATFYTDTNPRGVNVDGIWSEEEKALDFGKYDWAVVSGSMGAWMNRVTYLNAIPFEKILYYKDDALGNYDPDEERGAISDTGYNFNNLHKVQKGQYEFISHIYVPVGYKPGMERKYLNIVDHPLKTLVTPLANPAIAPATAPAP